jgi:hypothetical protein
MAMVLDTFTRKMINAGGGYGECRHFRMNYQTPSGLQHGGDGKCEGTNRPSN